MARFGREIAHGKIISDVNNFILREFYPLEAWQSVPVLLDLTRTGT